MNISLRPFAFAGLAGCLALGLAGCGGGSSASDTVANLLAFNSTKAPPTPEQKKEIESDEYCPSVEILENAAAHRSYAGGGDNQALRHQISITDVARQCTAVPGGGYVLKVGIETRFLIGPAGSAGTFSAPLRIVVKRGEQVVATRLRVASGTVPAGQANATFSIVEEGIQVPPGDAEARIEVSMGGGSPAAAKPRRRR